MIKQFVVGLMVVVVLCSSVLSPKVHAAGGSALTQLTASATSVATGATVTFTAYQYMNTCSNGTYTSEPTCSGEAPVGQYPLPNPMEVYIVSGESVVIGGANGTGNGARIQLGSDGKASFTVSSTAAGSKTIGVGYYGNSYAQVAITFVAPSAPAASKPKPTSTPTPTPEPTPPASPVTTEFEVAGQKIASTEKPTIENGKPLVLRGTTVPNGVVKLYIFSTPREATVTADAWGRWSYEVKGLEAGSHHVEAEVTDPTTNKISERKTLAEFTLAATRKPATATTKTSSAKASYMPVVGGTVLAVILLGAGAWWVWRRKKHALSANEVPVDINLPTDSKLTGTPR